MFRIKIEKNLVNLVNPVEKVPPQEAKFIIVSHETSQQARRFLELTDNLLSISINGYRYQDLFTK